MLTLITWLMWCFKRFLHCKFNFPLLYTYAFLLSGQRIYINYLEFFCKEDLSLFPHLAIQLFIYVQTHKYLYNTVGSILQYHFILFFGIVQTLAVGSLSVISWVSLLWYIFLSTFSLSITINASDIVYFLCQPPNKIFLLESLVVFIRTS